MMINKLSQGIAGYIKRIEPDNTPSIAVMSYSLYIILHTAFTVLLILLASIAMNTVWETLSALFFFMLLRIFGGGYHLHSSLWCTVLSIGLICSAPYFDLEPNWIIGINVVNILLIFLLSPRNFKGYARIPEKYYPLMKTVTAIVAGSNFYWQNSTLLVVTVCFAILLIPKQEGGENK